MLKEFNLLYFCRIKMDLPLLDQFRFNLVLWLLITFYGASGLWNFAAYVPGCSEDDMKILRCNNRSSYSSWLISSLLFFLLGISQFRYVSFIYLTMWEMYLSIFVYLILIFRKWHYLKQNRDKEKEIARKRIKSSPNKEI